MEEAIRENKRDGGYTADVCVSVCACVCSDVTEFSQQNVKMYM